MWRRRGDICVIKQSVHTVSVSINKVTFPFLRGKNG